MTQPTFTQDPISASIGEPANLLTVSGSLDLAHIYTDLLLPSGERVRIPTSLLQPSTRPASSASQADADRGIVIPLVEESLIVGKRTVETGKVRLLKTVQEFDATLNETLAIRTFDIDRVILNQPVETAPAIRQEGDTTIYPVVEEQLILTKQLILKEELRVTKRDTERIDNSTVTLRREHLTVERE